MNQQIFRANGKLLLSGEYFVLDGAIALGLPTKLGQRMEVAENDSEFLEWESINSNGKTWFDGRFSALSFSMEECMDQRLGERLDAILGTVFSLEPFFLYPPQGTVVTTFLEFPKDWGLGSSSTLIYNLANWAKIDPYELLECTFGGSGYDIACAGAEGPIFYQKKDGLPHSENANFLPPFVDQLYFIYLEKKQNSREGIAHYETQSPASSKIIDTISNFTKEFASAQQLEDFEKILLEHELLISKQLKLERAKDLYFKDYWGGIKSLGAWGGDFVLATSNRSAEETKSYFNDKGYNVVLSYKDLIL